VATDVAVSTDVAYHHWDDCVCDHWTLDSVSDFGYLEKRYIKLKVIIINILCSRLENVSLFIL